MAAGETQHSSFPCIYRCGKCSFLSIIIKNCSYFNSEKLMFNKRAGQNNVNINFREHNCFVFVVIWFLDGRKHRTNFSVSHTHTHTQNAAWVVLSSLLLNTSNNMLSAIDMAGLDTSLFTWSFVPHGDTPCRSSACQLPSIKREQGHQPPPSLPLSPHSLDRRSSAGGILPWPRLSDLLLIATHSEQCIFNKTQQQKNKQTWH